MTKDPADAQCALPSWPERVLIICEAGNVASAKTIECHGGVLEDVRDTGHGTARRYWIKIGEPSA